ncbi:MAG: hypothetical protein N4A71_15935 [Carboxylicivirga sp.]|jgi:hypothetical protein|nr:hypothetical protein [Carboxylicivirga sp.]MCT4646570.1 hypothetical protein [Carboxylicivirga sp.]
MIIKLITALGEIRMHSKVAGIEFPRKNEVQVIFKDTYADLIIPVTQDMDTQLMVGIFYDYISQPESKLAIA